MTTEKYDLHTADYSVQGADAILTSDMEQLDDVIPSRIIGTLGETVAAYKALYLKASDGKWYKAQANGVKQPCLGISVEGKDVGDVDEVIGTDTLNYTCIRNHISDSTNKPITGANWAIYWIQAGSSGIAWVSGTAYISNEIRIHRMGEIINAGWAWATIGAPIYLDPTTAGELTQTPPDENSQIIGYALTATNILVMIEPIAAAGGGTNIVSRGGTVLSPTVAINVIVWRAPFACTVTNVRGYRVGGTGATINARLNGVSNHLAAALSLTSADVWMDGGAVQNTAYVAGDKLEIMVVTVAGTPTQIAIQVDFTIS